MDLFLWPTIGGIMIGLAASLILISHGRIMGVSGIIGGLLTPDNAQTSWRLSFLGGLLSGGLMLTLFMPHTIVSPENTSPTMIAIAGLLVGYGTRLGNGCTSGHGICGLTRFSIRSLVATMTFMATGFCTATCITLFLK